MTTTFIDGPPPVLRLGGASEGRLAPDRLPEVGALDEPQPLQAGFQDILAETVWESARLGHVAGAQATAFAQGLHDDLHGTMIAGREADISLKLVSSIRSKLLDAFHELWRIGV